jgi:GDP-L-fucose synthase
MGEIMRILITGAAGMLGRSLASALATSRPDDLVIPLSRGDVDLRDGRAVRAIFEEAQPDMVLHAAARVGGIAANIAHPTSYLADNLAIDSHVIESSRELGVQTLVYFGSSCMYPRDYRQPLVEQDVLAAPLEPTNEGYAIAKIAGSKLCEYISREFGLSYRTLIPSNLYGPYDHFGSHASHLVAAAIFKAHQAKQSGAASIDVWGDGSARREFTYVGDLATWVAVNLDHVGEWAPRMNVGYGTDHSVLDFYRYALDTVGYDCSLVTDPSKPAGMAQKLMDSSLASTAHGWHPDTDIRTGMRLAYEAFLAQEQR